jgi:hypothetical protein
MCGTNKNCICKFKKYNLKTNLCKKDCNHNSNHNCEPVCKKLDVLYYSGKELLQNSSIYYPSTKENNGPLDICFLDQVKADVYNQCGVKVGVFQALNSFRIDDNDGINTGFVTVKTDKGIFSCTEAYDAATSIEPCLPLQSLFTKVTFVSGIYAQYGLDVFIKIIRFNDCNQTRKIEIYY